MDASSPAPGLPRLTGVLLFALAFALRGGYLLACPQTPLLEFCDSTNYQKAGRAIGRGEFPPFVLARMGKQGPVYPALLGLTFAAQGSDDVRAVRWLQAGLDSLACVLAAAAAGRLAGRCAGLIAGLLLGCHPGLILHTGAIHTETVATFLLAAAMLALARLPGTAAPARAALAGTLLGLACLTRVTLLPAVPFLVLASAGTALPGWRSWLPRAAAVGLGSAVVLGGWALAARALGVHSTVSGNGAEQQLGVIRAAADPARHGWAITSGLPDEPPLREPAWRAGPARTAVLLAHLVFSHVWYSDNIWRERYLLDPAGMDAVQRFVSVCGLFGAALLLLRPAQEGRRPGLFLLALVAGLAVTSAKYVEVRPTLPYQPGLCVLAGLFLAALGRPLRRFWPWAGGAALLALVAATRFASLARLWPQADPSRLGLIADAAALGAILGLGVLVSLLLRGRRAGRPWAVGCGAATLLALGYAASLHTNSAPRWRSWHVDLAGQTGGVRQRICFPQAIDPDTVESVSVVADLTSGDDLPNLDLCLDGVRQPDALWRPTQPWGGGIGVVLGGLTDFTGRPWRRWPQWWECPLPPAALAGRSELTLELHARGVVRLGGTNGQASGGRYRGPALVRPGLVSCYRWEVLEDWRVWEKAQLASPFSAGEILGPRDRQAAYAAGALARGQASLGIRVVVRYKDGRRVVY